MPEGSKMEQHRTLFHRMSDAVGVDLAQQAQAGNFPPEDETALIQRCVRCLQPAACADLLDSGAVLSEPPDYCENVARLLAMRSDG
ncbi:DUF6455 family protein [Actibacterium ureilyticum]|uniref:DUF6455 family protein n=1 Tax=Actibacterium ureilyticum TaxID=1590614 RepID=UPI000BAA99F5|nr:DUF6455 family protein [Actibacterium ureilyticum]